MKTLSIALSSILLTSSFLVIAEDAPLSPDKAVTVAVTKSPNGPTQLNDKQMKEVVAGKSYDTFLTKSGNCNTKSLRGNDSANGIYNTCF